MRKKRLMMASIIPLIISSLGVIPHTTRVSNHSMGWDLPAHFFIPLGKVGVKEPVRLTTRAPLDPTVVKHDLVVHPHVPVTVRTLSPHRYLIMPKSAWPSKSLIRIGWQSLSDSVVLHTDDDREVVINLSNQTLTAYRDHEMVRSILVSTGAPSGWATETGTFRIYKRVLDDHMVGGDPHTPDHWDVQHVPYAQYFNGAVAIHGAWWNHRFGRPISHGCVQLPTNDGPHGPTGQPPEAQWLWRFTDLGTPVIVTGHTPVMASATKAPLPYPSDSP